MNITELVQRVIPSRPWSEGDNIPWNEPGFSQRMLREHLSQEYNAASRKSEIIDQHVMWLHRNILGEKPAQILDLGCGPGLYTSQLAKLGHNCVGIDYSPASIRYARETARQSDLECVYIESDLRIANYSKGYDLVMQIFGEINVFNPKDAKVILEKACQALIPGGTLLLEVHKFETIKQVGELHPTWYAQAGGLWSESPYLCLKEYFWQPDQNTATIRYFIIEEGNPEIKRYAQSLQAYSTDEYRTLLEEAGLAEVEFLEFEGDEAVDEAGKDFLLLVAHK